MNRIEKLIQEYCLNVVDFMELGMILDYEQPTKYIVESAQYNDDYETPVLTAGQSFILGYTDENDGIYQANKLNPVIIFDDFTTSFHWVDFNFKVKSSAMKMIKPKNNNEAIFKYVYYAMNCINYKPQDHARQWISVYSTFRIPVPPLPVQQEIVNILDKFNQLEDELNAELEARRKQYDFYLNQLMGFKDSEVEWKTLGEVGEFVRGKRFVKNDITKEGIPCIHYGELYTHYGIWTNSAKSYLEPNLAERLRVANPGDVIIVSTGETIEDIGNAVAWLGDTEIVIHDACFAFSHKQNPKYVSYFLRTNHFRSQIRKYISSGKISSINDSGLSKAKIPVPSLEEQERIVSILDKFDALVNDSKISIQAEIEARRKQYEYYRNKLLTFEEYA